MTAFWSINDKGKVDIDPKTLLGFIDTSGFKIYRQSAADKKWFFVAVENMIVRIVDIVDIKKHVLDYVDKHAPLPVYKELQMKNRYFENTFLNALPLIEVEQIRDEADSSYIFFKKCYYQITAKDITKKDYASLKGRHIWEDQISKKEITGIVEYKNHPFTIFVYNAMGGLSEGGSSEKFKSCCASLGYLIHTYKKKSLAKLIYTCDEGAGELDGMAMGGTGKNLLLECLKYVRSVAVIDGKDFDKRDKFKFQTITDDTQIISIDDYEGDIKELFTKVTGHFEVEKKGLEKNC